MRFLKRSNNTPKRQWGTERRTKPLPRVHDIPSTARLASSRLAIIVTIGLWAVYFVSTIIRQFFDGPQTYQFTMHAIGYLVVMSFLTFSALMYLLARQGALQRFAKHVRTPRAELDAHFSTRQPSVTALVPAYDEEPSVVRKTLISAAIQEYPDIRVVLLIDDKPFPTNERAAERLNTTRALADNITQLFELPRERFMALHKQSKRKLSSVRATHKVVDELISNYQWASRWLYQMADNEQQDDHVDAFFADEVLRELAKELDLTSQALSAARAEGVRLPNARIKQLYQRLAWIFDFKISVFERKRYASLSHEPNKAMNLNSYIGLMGGTYQIKHMPDGSNVLLPATKTAQGSFTIADSEYLLTLDADSILLRDYCLRLVYLLEQPENERVAVTQTPYSSFRGAATRIERLAGATTDIQHILHQGMTRYNATFWVGANAVIRKTALADIAETETENGFTIHRFIQDRTVIEDTESSVDLTRCGWTLVNYPERLSYSATPPDFGSLIVQRRRWANGGLLIMSKLIAQIKPRQRAGNPVNATEFMLRTNYMASIAWASFGLIFLLAYPYDGRLLSPLIILAALPYFMVMASDLKYCGYRRSDIFRIYGFNLILLPVNLAGVLKSLQQMLTNKKIPFARTPKVKDRTVSPMLYVIAPLLIIGFSVFTFWRDYSAENWGNAAFAAFNALLATWATLSYIGIRNTILDIWHGMTDWLYVERITTPTSGQAATEGSSFNWQSVLYYGDERNAPTPINAMQTSSTTIESRNVS